MKSSSRQLRYLIRQTLVERQYHEPVHAKGYEREGYEREYTPQNEAEELKERTTRRPRGICVKGCEADGMLDNDEEALQEKEEEKNEGRIMKLTQQQLRRIIQEALLKEEMLNIISNPHSPETEMFNRIANYALTNDITGALADSKVNTSNLDWDLDDMRPWVNRVGGTGQWMEEDAVVPDNWDAKAVYGFMERLEDAWSDQQGQAADTEHFAADDVEEREVIGVALGTGYVLPQDISSITYQVRRKGGKTSNINIEDDNTIGNIDSRDAKMLSTTLDKIIKVLDAGGATSRKKQKPVKHAPPMYD